MVRTEEYMMQFYNKEFIAKNATGLEDIPDMAIVVSYPSGEEFLYLIWNPDCFVPLCGPIPYYAYPAKYAILKPKYEDKKLAV